MIRCLVAVVLALGLAGPAAAQQVGKPGEFDYYLLSLSWSPTWCASKAGTQTPDQCAPEKRFGFVVHGLWPQHEAGGYPQSCAAPGAGVSGDTVTSMLPIMPSRTLIEHEWSKHGTCSAATATNYFATVRNAYDAVRIPAVFRSPERQVSLSVAEVEKLFAAANPGLAPNMIAVTCRGRFVSEIRVCLDKSLKFRTCGAKVDDRCKSGATFMAVR